MKTKRFILHLFLMSLLLSLQAQNTVYMAPDGNDQNEGSIDYPVQTLQAARNKARELNCSKILVRGGRYLFNSTCVLSSQDDSLSISAYPSEKVIFDGGVEIDANAFELVTDTELASRLHKNAGGKVYSQVITDSAMIAKFKEDRSSMMMNGIVMNKARFPNIGYAHALESSIDKSKEEKRALGTVSNPKGASFTIYEKNDVDFTKWSREISRTNNVWTQGYVSAVWKPEQLKIASVNGERIQWQDGTSYGIMNGVKRVRFYTVNLLCELDEEGEWMFDATNNRLFIWAEEDPSNQIYSVWKGKRLFDINGNHITIENITIQGIHTNIAGSASIIVNGDNNTIAGVTFRNMSECAFRVYGSHNTITSCDVFDTLAGILKGGKFNAYGVEHGGNVVENCHFTRIHTRNIHDKLFAVTGAGNTVRNNLFHNSLGQPMTMDGVDHQIYNNEMFNVGIEEGDGGALYIGGKLHTYGNRVYQNFAHHIMCIPGLKLGRAAFFQDDYSGGGEYYNNIFYKAGDVALKMNKGSGMYYHHNIMLKGNKGIQALGYASSTSNDYKTAMNYIKNKDVNNGTKNNYICRMLKEIGKDGWKENVTTENWNDWVSDYWKENYNFFEYVMNKYSKNKTFYMNEVRLYHNYMYQNNKDVSSPVGINPNKPNIKWDNMDMFKDPSILDLGFKADADPTLPNIDFDTIGLYKDEYRCQVPDKELYRKQVKDYFYGTPCYYYTNNYDYANVNNTAYYNTGELVLNTISCGKEVMITAELSAQREVKEGNSQIVFTVTLGQENNTGQAITFGFDDHTIGDAIAGVDYEAIPEDARITVPVGSRTGNYVLNVLDDAEVEYVEELTFEICNPSNAYIVLKKKEAKVGIVDDEAILANFFKLSDGDEGVQDPTFRVVLSSKNNTGSDIHFDVLDMYEGTAVNNEDYTLDADSKITVALGDSIGDFVLPVLDDSNMEAVESVKLKISQPSLSNVLLIDSIAGTEIVDKDTATATLSAIDAYENDASGLEFKVTLSEVNETGEPIYFDFIDFDDGFAIATIDYKAVSSAAKIVVKNDSISGSYFLKMIDDDQKESNETVNVKIENCSSDRVTITGAQCTGNILDDESAAALPVQGMSTLKLYPNPVNDVLYIDKQEAGVYQLKVYDINGSLVLEKRNVEQSINLKGLLPGTYCISVESTSKTERLMIVKM